MRREIPLPTGQAGAFPRIASLLCEYVALGSARWLFGRW